MKKHCDCCGLPMTYDVDGSCIDCALLTIDDEVAQHACVMAVTHLIADAIKDPTLGMPGLRSVGGSVTYVPPQEGPELGVSRNGSFPVRPDRHQPVSQTVAKDCQGGCGRVHTFPENQQPEVWYCGCHGTAAGVMVPMADVVTYDLKNGCSMCGIASNYAKSDTRGRCYECSVKP